MCSVGWRSDPDDGGYELFFNRDEQWSRPLSLDPVCENDRLFARDPQGGGTWLSVNTSGMTLAVLNYYQGRMMQTKAGLQSRGQLPLLAGQGSTPGDILPQIETLDWEKYAPCFLLMLAPVEKARLWLWDGEMLQSSLPMPRHFITTSSVDTEAICARRVRRFEALAGGGLEAIFDETCLENPAAGIYMTRADAGTVSQTRVRVGREQVSLAVRRRNEGFLSVSAPRVA